MVKSLIHLNSSRALRRHLIYMTAIFWGLIGLAWWMYPTENRYSIMSHTFSFLGSFEEQHSPRWWWLFTVAMVFWGVTMVPLALYHYRSFAVVSRWGAAVGTFLFLLGALGTILVGLFPDASDTLFGQWRWTEIHEGAAILVFVGFALGIWWHAGLLIKDALTHRKLRAHGKPTYRRFLWPYLLWSAVLGVAVYYQLSWDYTYRQMKADAQATGAQIGSSWAESINTVYAFPLWENIVIYTLFAFIVWFSLAIPAELALAQEQEENYQAAAGAMPPAAGQSRGR